MGLYIYIYIYISCVVSSWAKFGLLIVIIWAKFAKKTVFVKKHYKIGVSEDFLRKERLRAQF